MLQCLQPGVWLEDWAACMFLICVCECKDVYFSMTPSQASRCLEMGRLQGPRSDMAGGLAGVQG